jgi:hypothetical protein
MQVTDARTGRECGCRPWLVTRVSGERRSVPVTIDHHRSILKPVSIASPLRSSIPIAISSLHIAHGIMRISERIPFRNQQPTVFFCPPQYMSDRTVDARTIDLITIFKNGVGEPNFRISDSDSISHVRVLLFPLRFHLIQGSHLTDRHNQ